MAPTTQREHTPPEDAEQSPRQPRQFLLEFDDKAAFHLVNFYEPETVDGESFRWSEPVSMVRLDVPPSDYNIVIEISLLRGQTFPLNIFWNDQQINKRHVEVIDGEIRFNVTRDMFIRNDEQRLTISCKPLNAEKGRRQLGVPMKTLRMLQTGSSEPEFANPTRTRSRFWRRNVYKSKLKRLIGIKSPSPALPVWEMKLPDLPTSLRNLAEQSDSKVDPCDTVIVSSVEINSRHGTGLLIQYMFEDFSQITTVSSQRRFHNERVRSARHHEVPCDGLARHEIYALVLKWFKDSPPKRAYIVPYYKTELVVAIAMADLFGTEVCLHVMDDQCLYEDEIPLDLMNEAMDKSALILLISPEMREAYQERFDHRMYILPPVVPENMLQTTATSEVPPSPNQPQHGIGQLLNRFRRQAAQPAEPRGTIIGNIWDEKWLAKLLGTISGSGFEVDWYSNNPDTVMLSTHKDRMIDCGVHVKKPLWGQELIDELRRRPYAIMPSGMLGPDEAQESLARLSLPSRLPFVMSTSNMPIIVLGSAETAAGKFVQRFQLGAVIDYDQQQFSAAAGRIMQPEVQTDIRSRAAQMASTFSATNLAEWIADSTNLKQPVDNRFESLFAGRVLPGNRMPIARRNNWSKGNLRTMLTRLKQHGLEFENVIDIGSGSGQWSAVTSEIFPAAKFVLVEPLLPHYSRDDRQQFTQSLGQFDELQTAVGDSQKRNELSNKEVFLFDSSNPNASSNLANGSTLDSIASSKNLSGSTLLKIDCRQSEALVLAGGVNFVRDCVETIVLTVDLMPKHALSKSYGELVMMLDGLGFQLIDESEASRCPSSNILLSKNLLFVKREISQRRLAA